MEMPSIYQIVVEGELSEKWAEWFGGLSLYVAHHGRGATTMLAGPVADQAALRGILGRLWDLNLVLLSVVRVPRQEMTAPAHADGGAEQDV